MSLVRLICSCGQVSFANRLLEIAERTAEHLGLQLHKSIVDEQVIADHFEEATWHSEHLIPDLNYIGKSVHNLCPQSA